LSRRDPAGRRRAIIEAAVEVIAENGIDAVTHRRVAAAAGVPVGSTTYYFKDLKDLVHAALSHATDLTVQGLDQWSQALEASTDPAATLAELTGDYLAERDRFRTVNELYTAAAHHPELRPLARAWSDGLTGLLIPHADPHTARAAAVFIDGALLHALIHDQPLDTTTLTTALTALLASHEPTPARQPAKPDQPRQGLGQTH
jgi:TetR/AcrR family transcriptional regulator, regulator of biofilm formation and stress response